MLRLYAVRDFLPRPDAVRPVLYDGGEDGRGLAPHRIRDSTDVPCCPICKSDGAIAVDIGDLGVFGAIRCDEGPSNLFVLEFRAIGPDPSKWGSKSAFQTVAGVLPVVVSSDAVRINRRQEP